MESLVKLTVKTPNQGIDDIQVNCDLDWTVRKLKDYLQDVYPSNPASSSQRLIYLGRLLQDHLSLKEVFGEWGARTVHIVCNEANDKMTASTPTSTKVDSSITSVPVSTSVSGSDGLRFRASASLQGLPSNRSLPELSSRPSPALLPHLSSLGSTPPFQADEFHQLQSQMMQQYQYQMQQYYQQWHQWQQAIGGGQWPYSQHVTGMFPTPPNTPNNRMPTPTTPLPPQPNIVQPQAQQQQPPEVAAFQQNREAQGVPMNAGPGGVGMEDEDDENENGRNRDWLDWVYTSLRALMLLSIIYFYSSTSRFILVTFLAFLLYLYQNGWFAPIRVVHAVPPVEQPINVPAQGNVGQDDINGQQNNSDEQDTRDNNSDDQPLQNEPPKPSVIRILCTFVVSFVTSLIPSPPPAIAPQ